jgi:hypothetical protein
MQQFYFFDGKTKYASVIFSKKKKSMSLSASQIQPTTAVTTPIIPTLRPSDLCSACFFGDMARVKELLFVEPVEDDPPLDGDDAFDPTAPADEELEAENAERQAQRDANDAEILAKLHDQPGTVVSRKTPVDVIECGLGIEVLAVENGGSKVRGVFVPKSDAASLKNKATPLHWACLAREHEIVAYLISLGADPDFVSNNSNDNSSKSANPFKISARQLCKANHYHETLRVVDVCAAKFKEGKDKLKEAKEGRAETLRKRDELRSEAARKQREEEEREAAGEEGGYGDDGGHNNNEEEAWEEGEE